MKALTVSLAIAAAAASLAPAYAAESRSATDAEIRIGQTMAYSGPASAYSVIARAEAAYFKMVNDQGGVNGRKINFISLDDGLSPPKTFEQTRKLVEDDGVVAIFNPLGTPTGVVVRKYLNDKKIPQLFVGAGAQTFGDYKDFPYTIGYQPNYQIEATIYARHMLANKPDAKVALFYRNDDAGRDYANGFKAGLGGPDAAKKYVVSETTFESSDPTVDAQILKMKNSGADVMFMHANPKQGAQAIRKMAEIGWRPIFYLSNTIASVAGVLKPAGLENSKGLITAAYLKDPNDPQWKDDPGYKKWLAFMKQYYPDGDLSDALNAYGYTVAETLVKTLQQCGKDVTPANIMKQAANLNYTPDLTLPGVDLKTSPTDYYPIKKMVLQRFNGEVWETFSQAMSGE
ncbi:MAG: ABC transporter substrate-binding protein [Rhodoblastus sp.]